MTAADAEPDRPLRILWLIKGLGPGGAEQLLVNQAKVRDAERFDVEAAYLVPWKDHLVADLAQAGVASTCLEGAREWDLRWAWRLRRRLRAAPVDVIHNHSPYVAAITRLIVRTLPRDRRPVLVYTEHNRWPRHARATRLMNRLTFRLDDAQLSVSDDVRATIPAGLASRVTTLVHGVVLDDVRGAMRARPEVRAELGIGDDEIVVGIVANFRREKDYDSWLAAARRALDTSPVPLRFVSVGQGPLEEQMRARHDELGLGDRVLLLGYRDDAVRIMSAFDLFTLASQHEGLPVSLMDALALGLPVAATAVGGIPQAVTDGVEGLLVPSGQPEALADAITALAADPTRRSQMSAAARVRSEDFDIAVATRELERIYTRTAATRRRAPRPESLRILQVITDTDRRGAQVFATDLHTALEARGHHVRTVALAPGTNVEALAVPTLGPTRVGPPTLRALRREMAAHDVTAAHGSTTLSACGLAGLGPGRPFVYRQISDSRFWAPTWARRARVRLLMRTARFVVALAPTSAQVLVDYLGVRPERIRVVPNGVPSARLIEVDEAARTAARAELGLGLRDAPVLMFAGALVPEKGADLAIDAAAATGTVLLIAGDGPERGALEAQAATTAPGLVRFLGSMSDPLPAYAACDLVVLPSRGGDSMPATLIEAGLAGRAAVSTAVGAIPDIVADQETGRVVPPGDRTRFVDAVRSLLDDVSTRESMARQARIRCTERFTIDVVAEGWEAVLETAAGSRRGRSRLGHRPPTMRSEPEAGLRQDG